MASKNTFQFINTDKLRHIQLADGRHPAQRTYATLLTGLAFMIVIIWVSMQARAKYNYRIKALLGAPPSSGW